MSAAVLGCARADLAHQGWRGKRPWRDLVVGGLRDLSVLLNRGDGPFAAAAS